MAAIVFKDDEQGYMLWIKKNPEGYVLTTFRQISPDHMSLHRSNCKKVNQYNSNMTKGAAFTRRKYIKICSNSKSDLLDWIKLNKGSHFTKLCSVCAPDSTDSIYDDTKHYYSKLNAEVSSLVQKSPEELKDRAGSAPAIPGTLTITTTIYKRNPNVIAYALLRANGHCERCGDAAPFFRASDGSPYLEVHHQVPLSEGGEDTIENTLALCPNCHREAHFGLPDTNS